MATQPDISMHTGFMSCYLQRVTQELCEDLDTVRNADDFKAESVQFLVHALQQGAQQFSSTDQQRALDHSHHP